ncbi:MAG: T9SS type A sorting domain-containing protein [Flavobacteriaceae bacterium]|nr:T9SS type A sorting domain-containing protein [Flavobacteriaceae bacterium]
MKKKYCLAAVVFLLALQSFAQFIDDVEYPPGATPGNWWICDTIACTSLPTVMEYANTGEYSVKVGDDPTTIDADLSLGNKTEGVWGLSYYMYVPIDKEAYFNLQGVVPIGSGEWIVGNIFLNQDLANPGVGLIDNCVGAPVNFNFPHGEWFNVTMNFDFSMGIANSTWSMMVDGITVIQDGTPFTDNQGTIPTSLGGVNWYAISTNNTYYLDTFVYSEGPIPPANEFVDDMEYSSGIPETSFWWVCDETNTCSIEITQDQAYDGSSSGYISDIENTNQLLHLSNRFKGQRGLEFYMYVPSGKEAVFELQGNANGAVVESIVGDIVFNENNTDPGVGYITDTNLGNVNFNFPHDQWFKVNMDFNMDPWIGDSTWGMYVDNTEVIPVGTPFTNSNSDYPNSLGALNFKAQNTTSGYYLDAFQFVEGSILSISSERLVAIELFPNPTSGIVSILSTHEIQSIHISDISGKTRELKVSNELDLSEYTTGIYFVTLETSEGIQTKKIIKQ